MISVIIPTYNEQANIAATVKIILEEPGGFIQEIVVVDGGSIDGTVEKAASSGAKVLVSSVKGRSAQMNAGALVASGSVLYFLHADTVPPKGFAASIMEAVADGISAGCFRLAFDYEHWFLRLQCWFTRFDVDAFRYGDQSLFVIRDVFEKCGGFRMDYVVFEDNEIISRLKKAGKFSILESTLVTSARKYLDNGVYKTQFIFYLLYFLYRGGLSQAKLVSIYKSLIRQEKI